MRAMYGSQDGTFQDDADEEAESEPQLWHSFK